MSKASRKKVPCPYCRKVDSSLEDGIWPFCSERCKMADIGEWVAEKYTVPCEDSETPEELNFNKE